MTKTIQLLRLMADGQPRSIVEIMAAFGWARIDAEHAMRAAAKYGHVASQPVRYTVTASGIDRSKFEKQSDEERLRKNRIRVAAAKRAKRLAAQKVREKSRKQAEKAEIAAHAARLRELVPTAIRNRHALDLAWGST